eukprot:CAMPEP_0183793568 /NCGR_PEP_ID=MMETSP0803_2-20130417/3298_1 /TAXON_ID=195967 /ORGANISM="Crustomastix stigmata, Strain CCMP3273" /LENGTH=120 /DNA_ID=CAMNT_0026037951 /DNA_START=24 /DNA_END=386 /DNA_ORIENTATION=-
MATVAAARRAPVARASPARRVAARRAPVAKALPAEVAQVALELDSDTVFLGIAAVLGVGAGVGLPVLFAASENRDRQRVEEIRELNRATLKATGETLSEDEIADMRPTRYLDRREFRDDD